MPIIVAVIIMLFPVFIGPAANSAFGTESPLPQILTHGFALMVMFAIPILVGLIWNKWAGGAAGFLLGTLYYLAYAGYYSVGIAAEWGAPYYPGGLYRDPSFIGNYIVGGVLIGYIAGALNNKSWSFKRMFGAGMTAAFTVGIMQFVLNYQVSFGAWMTQSDPLYAFWTTMLPMVILGVIGPIVAKVMTWYGIYPGGQS
ncbi:MAG: hypothetical protein NWF05_06375 [Candidatus Bathyarchaeota archaeon]|nr:hypothetical protein [Candidatus Bathyarchaeota archaeon]